MRASILALPVLLFLACEVAAFVVVGRQIGVLATIGLTFATAVLGSVLLRLQGLSILSQIRREVDSGTVPSRQLAHGLMIIVAGVLLMIPGFLSDILGLLLFLPPIRDFAWSLLSRRVLVRREAGTWPDREYRHSPSIIELRESEYERRPKPESRTSSQTCQVRHPMIAQRATSAPTGPTRRG